MQPFIFQQAFQRTDWNNIITPNIIEEFKFRLAA